MKLTMTTNLGLLDARRLGIPQAVEGETIDADKAAAEALLKCGWAVAAPEEPHEPPRHGAHQAAPHKKGE